MITIIQIYLIATFIYIRLKNNYKNTNFTRIMVINYKAYFIATFYWFPSNK